MDTLQIVNARIVRTHLGPDDRGIGITGIYLTLDFDGYVQSVGGYSLHRDNLLYHFISGVLQTVEVAKWEDLTGTYIRVERDFDRVYRIGHILKDQWIDLAAFCP